MHQRQPLFSRRRFVHADASLYTMPTGLTDKNFLRHHSLTPFWIDGFLDSGHLTLRGVGSSGARHGFSKL